MKTTILAAGLLAAGAASAQDLPELVVYAPDYFASEWGPGPGIEAGFEATCGCDLVYRTGDVLPRLLLEGARTEADVAIGLNTDQTVRAREAGIFAAHGQDPSALTLPVAWEDEVFLPFNWSYVAFVYDKGRVPEPPESFAALLEADDISVIIQDPRASISGLALVLWAEAVFGDEAEEAWAALSDQVVTVTQDWSTSYGLFTSGESDMVLSYVTSPAYHIMAEEDDSKAAAIFEEGHYLFVELAAKVAGTDRPELADAFMAYVLSEEFQSMIPTSNWSYPAALPEADWPGTFRDLPRPDRALFYDEETAEAVRDRAVEAWRRGLTR